jgi:hypothetical protein
LVYRRERRESENPEEKRQILRLENKKQRQFLGVLGFSAFSAIKQPERIRPLKLERIWPLKPERTCPKNRDTDS